jgi:hypothetical protein
LLLAFELRNHIVWDATSGRSKAIVLLVPRSSAACAFDPRQLGYTRIGVEKESGRALPRGL